MDVWWGFGGGVKSLVGLKFREDFLPILMASYFLHVAQILFPKIFQMLALLSALAAISANDFCWQLYYIISLSRLVPNYIIIRYFRKMTLLMCIVSDSDVRNRIKLLCPSRANAYELYAECTHSRPSFN